MCISDSIIDRLSKAENQRLEGQKICTETIQEMREIKGVSGVHMMAYLQKEAAAEIIENSGVLEGRMPWYPGSSATCLELFAIYSDQLPELTTNMI